MRPDVLLGICSPLLLFRKADHGCSAAIVQRSWPLGESKRNPMRNPTLKVDNEHTPMGIFASVNNNAKLTYRLIYGEFVWISFRNVVLRSLKLAV